MHNINSIHGSKFMLILRNTLFALFASLSSFCLAAPVDINSADAESLANEIKGVGLSRARAIVEYREMHGPFKKVDDLVLVQGIGPKIVSRNKDKLTVSKH